MKFETGSLGRYFVGDTVQATRVFYSSDTRPHPPMGAAVSASLLYDGSVLTVLSVNVLSVANRATDGKYGRAFAVTFTFQIPDGDWPSDTALTVALEATVYQSVDPTNFETVPLHETIVIEGQDDVPKGALSSIVVYPGEMAFPYSFRTTGSHTVKLDLFFGNQSVASYNNIYSAMHPVRGVPTFKATVNDSSPSLMPYAALWTVDGEQEVAPVFVINPSIMLAVREVHDFVNKNTSDWATENMTFTPEQIMAALYNGACLFNMTGHSTNFTMLNAQGVIRNLWIQYSSLWLLQSQVMNSVETDFSFTTSSVSLDVDRASKYQQYADSLQNQLDERTRALKTTLSKRGNISGDGSANPLSLNPGALAALGLSLSPVSKVGYLLNPLSWRAALLSNGSNIGFNSY